MTTLVEYRYMSIPKLLCARKMSNDVTNRGREPGKKS
jgi:hypothetical protein